MEDGELGHFQSKVFVLPKGLADSTDSSVAAESDAGGIGHWRRGRRIEK